mmetsp:Transcript_66280/g.146802  ORF Transcript_66280/g.146802 Transcript_66280/m.146802 type:complete len:251 (+) Transcript_66280:189-941(+)
MWIAGLVSAFLIKISSSIDDVVWLAPFLTSNSSKLIITQNTIIYTSVCLVQTLVATVIAYSGRAAVKFLTRGNKHAWSTEKLLTVVAGSLLAVYSIKLLYEYIQECREGDDEEKGEASPESGRYKQVPSAEDGGVELINAAATEIDCPSKPDNVLDKADKEKQQTLFVIAFIGSVDDLTLFVPMLVGKGFDLVQLVLGAFIAASVIVTLCIFIGLCKPIADCLSKVPLCLIVIVFAVVLLLKGLVFSDET